MGKDEDGEGAKEDEDGGRREGGVGSKDGGRHEEALPDHWSEAAEIRPQ